MFMAMNVFKPKDIISQELLSYLLFEHPQSEDGKLPPASFFAEKFSVSIVTIREVLKAMEATGILSLHHGRGIYLNHADTIFAEMFETRILIEGHCARLAARHIDDKGAARLESLLHELEEAAVSGNMDLYTDADFLLHMEIAAISGNLVLERTLRNIRIFLYTQQKETNRTLLPSKEQSIKEHRELFEAILSGDGDRAESSMKSHLERTRALWSNL